MKILNGNKIAIGMILASAGIMAVTTNNIIDQNTEAQNEIKEKNPELYDSLKRHSDADWENIVNWDAEKKKMNDALKLDSLVKKAYFEGAQMVRDSLMNLK